MAVQSNNPNCFRLDNLELMNKYGVNAWRVHTRFLEMFCCLISFIHDFVVFANVTFIPVFLKKIIRFSSLAYITI